VWNARDTARSRASAAQGTAISQSSRPLREVSVAKIVVKARLRPHHADAYLMQFDHASRQYQLIGGHREDADPDDMSAASRELLEELPENDFDLGYHDVLTLIGQRTITAVSRTFGINTTYHFTFFHLQLHHGQLGLGPDDCWITPGEMAAGYTSDLVPVRVANDAINALDEGLPGGLAGLPYSLRLPQDRGPFVKIGARPESM
jgi:8-oxo-dGTP pyrophosphatase MutT (NUDIX family)